MKSLLFPMFFFLMIWAACTSPDYKHDVPENLLKELELAKQYEEKGSDSAIYFFRKLQLISEKEGFDSLTLICNIRLGYAYDVRRAYVTAIGHYMRAIQWLDDHPEMLRHEKVVRWKVYAYGEVAICYFELDKTELAVEFSERAVALIDEKAGNFSQGVFDDLKSIILHNLASLYLEMKELDKAWNLLMQTKELNEQLKDELLESGIVADLALIYKEKGNYDSALVYLNQSLEMRKALGVVREIAFIHNNLGEIYLLKGDPKQAIEHLHEAIRLAAETSNYRSEQIAAQSLATAYAQMADYKKAYEYADSAMALEKKYFSNDSITAVSQSGRNYELEYKARQLEQTFLMEQQKEKSRKIILWLFIGFLLFLLLALILFIRLLRNRAKQLELAKIKVDLERELADQHRDLLQKELEHKNRLLATAVLFETRQNELIENISNRVGEVLKTDTGEKADALKSIIRDLKASGNKAVWKEFETRFAHVHQDFYNRLHQKFPDLSPAERRLAAFIKLNMSSKEIAALTFKSADGVKIARSRLRKKLGLAPEENLVSFIQSI